jgi:hypothetical protein
MLIYLCWEVYVGGSRLLTRMVARRYVVRTCRACCMTLMEAVGI